MPYVMHMTGSYNVITGRDLQYVSDSTYTLKVTKLVSSRVRIKARVPVFQVSFLFDDFRRFSNMYNNILLSKASHMAKSKVTGRDNPLMEVGKRSGEEVSIW